MSTLSRISMIPSVTRLMAHLRAPLFRNGYALVLSSTSTSALGLAYWVLAARSYSADTIGLNSAVISAMIFLANLAQFNLMNALNRFIPSAGRATARLIVYAYLVTTIIALMASLIFTLGVDVWAPTLSFLKSSPAFILYFTLATMAWCIFVLQDSALTGLRQATWVPIENLLFAVAKIALLVGLAGIIPQFGVFTSWTIPLAVLLLPINLLIFRRLIPRHIQATEGRAEPLVPANIIKYVAGDYFASLVWIASTNLLPLLVLERAGASANAYFYLAWTIAYSLQLVSRNMGQSLIAEAAADQTKLNIYSFQILVQTARLLVPIVAIVVVGAPYLLLLFGDSYATEGTTVLRLLCLSALPNIVTSLYISIARVQRRMISIVIVLSSLCILAIPLSYILLESYGITGVGIAWLLSQTIIAVVLLFTKLRTVWSSHLTIPTPLFMRSVAHRVWWYWNYRHRVTGARKLVPNILPLILPPVDTPSPTTWRIQRLLGTLNDITVITLGPKEQPPVALLKLAHTDNALMSLQRQRTVLAELHADERLKEWGALLPTLLAGHRTAAGQTYLVENVMPGLDARKILTNPATRKRMLVAAAAAIEELHQLTATSVQVDTELLNRWVDEPLFLIQRVFAARSGGISYRQEIERLKVQLHHALAGRTLFVSWIHGDFVPGNILVTPDGATVTGIVDWELATPRDLPQLDLLQLLLATRMLVQHKELGNVIREFLAGELNWMPHECVILKKVKPARPGDGDAVGLRELLLLCWLRHVAANLKKSSRYPRHWYWVSKNIEQVLQLL